MKHCRIIVTWGCNLKCPYCCNRYPEIYQSVVFSDMKTIVAKGYDEYRITGGEPLLLGLGLIDILNTIPRDKIVYLYTNGIYLDEEWAEALRDASVDGLNVGLHRPGSLSEGTLRRVNEVIPVRLFVQDTEAEYVDGWAPKVVSEVRTWHMDECLTMPEEKRYCLEALDCYGGPAWSR